MRNRTAAAATFSAFAIGALLWVGGSFLIGKKEPWDSSVYWTAIYPLSLLGCAWLGYRYGDRSWRWALVLFEGQFVAMCALSREVGSLWPLGMALFAVMALPGVAAAKLAARAGGRTSRKPA